MLHLFELFSPADIQFNIGAVFLLPEFFPHGYICVVDIVFQTQNRDIGRVEAKNGVVEDMHERFDVVSDAIGSTRIVLREGRSERPSALLSW